MKITLSQVETFYWVSRLKSFHAAARHQHLTQPTISARIHELESILGFRLFERNAQGAELTPKGASFLKKAEGLLQVADNMLAEDAASMRGLLRLGSNESAALTGLGGFFESLHQRYPALRIELTIDVGAILQARLVAGGLDFAINSNPSTHPHITNVLLGEQEMSWVAAKGTVKPGTMLEPADLAGMPLLTVPAPSSLHALIMGWFASARKSPNYLNTCNSLAVMLRLVTAGIAVAILPRPILQRDLDDGSIEIIETRRPVPPLPIYASFPQIGDTSVYHEIAEMARAAFLASNLIR